MKNRIPSALLALTLAGCATSGRKIDQTAAAQIQQGVTTKAEVRQLLGAPDSIIQTGDGAEWWTYSYTRASSRPSSFVPVVNLFAGGVDVQQQTVQVEFDGAGVVKTYAASQGASEVNTGLVNTGSRATMPDVEDGKRPR